MLTLLTSCDKAENLRAQQAELVQKTQLVREKSQIVESQIRALGPAGLASTAPVENQTNKVRSEISDLTAKTDAKEIQARDIQQKWSAVEKLVTDFQTKVDDWKAQNTP